MIFYPIFSSLWILLELVCLELGSRFKTRLAVGYYLVNKTLDKKGKNGENSWNEKIAENRQMDKNELIAKNRRMAKNII